MGTVTLKYEPNPPGLHFRALIGPGYVTCDGPGTIEVTDGQAKILLADWPLCFTEVGTKSESGPSANKMIDEPKANKRGRK